MTDNELRALWRDAGGSFHGPNIETGTMPESELLPLLRRLVSAEVERDALRVALATSISWLYGHHNSDGQAERRRLNSELLGQPAIDADKGG